MAAAAASRAVGSKLALREIRIHLCQRSPGSQGVRNFIHQRYVELKKAHPGLPILIRECSEVQPKLWARYGEYWSPEAGTRVAEYGLAKEGASQRQEKNETEDQNSNFRG